MSRGWRGRRGCGCASPVALGVMLMPSQRARWRSLLVGSPMRGLGGGMGCSPWCRESVRCCSCHEVVNMDNNMVARARTMRYDGEVEGAYGGSRDGINGLGRVAPPFLIASIRNFSNRLAGRLPAMTVPPGMSRTQVGRLFPRLQHRLFSSSLLIFYFISSPLVSHISP